MDVFFSSYFSVGLNSNLASKNEICICFFILVESENLIPLLKILSWLFKHACHTLIMEFLGFSA